MAVTKRLRYEILRRDNHACRYCGAVSPEVVLTVDHVVPLALGGSDDPSNLVAACRDCNSGKSATPPGASLTADVSADAVRWATALRAAYDNAIRDITAREDYVTEFLYAWEGWMCGNPRQPCPKPNDWEASVSKWYGLGLPIEILCDAINKAMPKKHITLDNMFRYVAGIVWRTHEELQRQVAAQLAVPEHPVYLEDTSHCYEPAECRVHGVEAYECDYCGTVGCPQQCAHLNGILVGQWMSDNRHALSDPAGTALREVCDRRMMDEVGA